MSDRSADDLVLSRRASARPTGEPTTAPATAERVVRVARFFQAKHPESGELVIVTNDNVREVLAAHSDAELEALADGGLILLDRYTPKAATHTPAKEG